MCTNLKVIYKHIDRNTGEVKYKYIGVPRWSKEEVENSKKLNNDFFDSYIVVECGKCKECREKWRRQLIQRTRHQMIQYNHRALFITLTFNDEALEKYDMSNYQLRHKPFQDFMKRLRGDLKRKYKVDWKLTYLMCGEYGGLNGRPHYHALIFGVDEHMLESIGMKIIHTRKRSKKGYAIKGCDELAEIWQNGFIEIGSANEKSAGYIAKYMVKYSEFTKADWKEMNGEDAVKPYMVYPHKTMGIDYFLENIDEIVKRGYIYNGKTPVGIPRSYIKYISNNLDNNELLCYYHIIEDRKNKFYEEMIEEFRKAGKTFIEFYVEEIEKGEARKLRKESR
nr:MAG: replication initiation protein [Microvirus Sku119]